MGPFDGYFGGSKPSGQSRTPTSMMVLEAGGATATRQTRHGTAAFRSPRLVWKAGLLTAWICFFDCVGCTYNSRRGECWLCHTTCSIELVLSDTGSFLNLEPFCRSTTPPNHPLTCSAQLCILCHGHVDGAQIDLNPTEATPLDDIWPALNTTRSSCGTSEL